MAHRLKDKSSFFQVNGALTDEMPQFIYFYCITTGLKICLLLPVNHYFLCFSRMIINNLFGGVQFFSAIIQSKFAGAQIFYSYWRPIRCVDAHKQLFLTRIGDPIWVNVKRNMKQVCP